MSSARCPRCGGDLEYPASIEVELHYLSEEEVKPLKLPEFINVDVQCPHCRAMLVARYVFEKILDQVTNR
ncbi:MAG: hypothetical protein J7L98_04495 [Candidatus Verstraetearchaeota archaeon]|nr:hypothetical protein [Candidatus Verstraetearchaeota archaeon]